MVAACFIFVSCYINHTARLPPVARDGGVHCPRVAKGASQGLSHAIPV